jgi:hypothetical protein
VSIYAAAMLALTLVSVFLAPETAAKAQRAESDREKHCNADEHRGSRH